MALVNGVGVAPTVYLTWRIYSPLPSLLGAPVQIIGKQAGIRTHDLTVLETVVFPIKLPACWLPGLDSNQRQQIQSLLCYHYTTRNY